MSDKYGKYLSPEDKEDTVFSSDRSQLHRDTVRDDLETSTQRDVIRQQGYLDTPQQPYYSAGAPESRPVRGSSPQSPVYHRDTGSVEPQHRGGYTSYHRQEESRRHEETLDTVRFDGDIDLDKEKKGINSAFEITITEQEQKRQLPRLRVLHQHQCTAQRNGSAI